MTMKTFILKALAGPIAFKQERIKAERPDDNLATFLKAFLTGSAEARVGRSVYLYLQEWIHVPEGFPLRPTDNLRKRG